MAKPETESDEPLSEMEMRRCSGFLRRAVMHGQAHGLVKLVAGQVHGRPIAVTCGDVLEQIQAMNDSSKRRIEFSETEESESWDDVAGESFMDRLHGFRGSDQPLQEPVPMLQDVIAVPWEPRISPRHRGP